MGYSRCRRSEFELHQRWYVMCPATSSFPPPTGMFPSQGLLNPTKSNCA